MGVRLRAGEPTAYTAARAAAHGGKSNRARAAAQERAELFAELKAAKDDAEARAVEDRLEILEEPRGRAIAGIF